MATIMVDQRNIWPAPAKINLFLHVVGKRPDGYHNLQTVFQFVDYGDELSFDLTDDGKITRSYDFGFDEHSDLCLRAAALLRQRLEKPNNTVETNNSESNHLNHGATINMTKRLPMGGGLGGGSSDAATVLIALNHLWKVGLNRQQLAELGLSLGADVPVFVMGKAAWAEGVGEQLTPINLPKPWLLVLTPDIQVSTSEIFCHKQLTPRPETMKIRALEKGVDFEFGENQLESIVRTEYPQVNALFEWLSEYGKPRMSGSGASIFMPLADQQSGLALLAQKPKNSTGFVAKGMNVHPLIDV